jgi:2,3-bisphosphoglycerate-independent phosphoglycerate mutase
VPTLLYGKVVRADGIAEFGEPACARGSLGVLPAKDVMPIALANARASSIVLTRPLGKSGITALLA